MIDNTSDKRICSICAWREHCVKRYKVSHDNLLYDINCPDFSKDVKFKDTKEEIKFAK